MYILEGLSVYGNDNFLKYMRRQHSKEEPYLAKMAYIKLTSSLLPKPVAAD